MGVRPFAAGAGVLAGEQAASTTAKAIANRRKAFKSPLPDATGGTLGAASGFAKPGVRRHSSDLAPNWSGFLLPLARRPAALGSSPARKAQASRVQRASARAWWRAPT